MNTISEKDIYEIAYPRTVESLQEVLRLLVLVEQHQTVNLEILNSIRRLVTPVLNTYVSLISEHSSTEPVQST